jgi:cytochrome oxidase assembly protein ShyY1
VADYRFARSPRWIATHLLVLAVVAAFVNLGFWQLRRLDERRDTNALVEARSSLPPEPVGELDGDPDELRFRAVVASGPMAGLRTVRANQGGAPGFNVLSAVDLGDGRGVVVLRGFAGTQPTGGPPEIDVPGEPVAVEGLAIPLDRTSAPLRREAAALGDELGLDLLPVLVQAGADADADVTPIPPPSLDDGPHLSYAVQWFLFTGVVVAGYPLLLRRRARG